MKNADIYLHKIPVGRRIREIRLASGATQKEFAHSLGIVQGFLSGIECGKKEPSETLLYAICHKYGVSEAWLFGGNDAEHDELNPVRSYAPEREGAIPLLERIPAGFPDRLPTEKIISFVQLPNIPAGCYAIIAEGDYMAPTIRDGDLVIFRPGEELVNKGIVLVSNRWGEVILRRCRIKGDETYLASDNAIYTPFRPNVNTRIFGAVVEVWRKVPI
jgi:transcriptional regulator with XRE-family HTH domain